MSVGCLVPVHKVSTLQSRASAACARPGKRANPPSRAAGWIMLKVAETAQIRTPERAAARATARVV